MHRSVKRRVVIELGIGEISRNVFLIKGDRIRRALDHGSNLRCKAELARRHAVIEGPHSEMIARAEQVPAPAVPDNQ